MNPSSATVSPLRQRMLDDSWSRVAKAKQALEDIRQLVAQ